MAAPRPPARALRGWTDPQGRRRDRGGAEGPPRVFPAGRRRWEAPGQVAERWAAAAEEPRAGTGSAGLPQAWPGPALGQRGCHTGQCPAAPALLSVTTGSGGTSARCEMPEGWARRGRAGCARWCLGTGPESWAHTETLSEHKETLFSGGG